MQTSYFAKTKNHQRAVSIARSSPRWFKGRRYMQLAPPWSLVKMEDEEEYTKEYRKILDKLDPAMVLEDLGEGAILLCWEKAGEFCHRRLVAEWLEEHLGITVNEI
jgi:uncharacterized protein (DUF488 family)